VVVQTNAELMAFLLDFLIAGSPGTNMNMAVTLSGGAD
jgi:hypothetical protein